MHTRRRAKESKRKMRDGGSNVIVDCSSKRILTQDEVDSFFKKKKSAKNIKSESSVLDCMPKNKKNIVTQNKINQFFKKKL